MARRLFVVDDHPITRLGYKALAAEASDLELVGEASDPLEALAAIPTAAPDLLVADISLDGLNGIELLKRLRTAAPDLPVLIVSTHDERLYAERTLYAGARGYLMKTTDRDTVLNAMRRVLDGHYVLSNTMSTRIFRQMAGSAENEPASPVTALSDRELEVFELVGRGFPTRTIAERLLISPKTVESHRSRIKRKLGLASSTELMRSAMHWVESTGS